ncbi:MAG: radical SAM protein [Thermodesulfobacteriota bacterium]
MAVLQEYPAGPGRMFDPLSPCAACPRNCGVDRRGGGKGFCGLDHRLHLSYSGLHFGEEPCLTGKGGVANFFFTSCNLACLYCQNFQISQDRIRDTVLSPEDFARAALELEQAGAEFLGLVSPSHQAPQIAEALVHAKKRGLSLPVVYNTNSYDAVASLRLFEGLVDVYLPDLKYADDGVARQYSGVSDYVSRSREALLEMYRQVGDMELNPETGLARRGLWARHLVLPEGAAGTWESLCFLALELSPRVGLSLMAQYNPLYRAAGHPALGRRITSREYEEALFMARDLGFLHVLSQDLSDSPDVAVPDFNDPEKPFARF